MALSALGLLMVTLAMVPCSSSSTLRVWNDITIKIWTIRVKYSHCYEFGWLISREQKSIRLSECFKTASTISCNRECIGLLRARTAFQLFKGECVPAKSQKNYLVAIAKQRRWNSQWQSLEQTLDHFAVTLQSSNMKSIVPLFVSRLGQRRVGKDLQIDLVNIAWVNQTDKLILLGSGLI